MLGLELKGTKTYENKEYVKELLKKYNLYDFKDKYPQELSGGMRQRAALIRTLAVKTKNTTIRRSIFSIRLSNKNNGNKGHI